MAHSAIWGHPVKRKKLDKNPEQFQTFLRLVSENTASMAHLPSTVCEMKGFIYFIF